jgi:hypothetical protein
MARNEVKVTITGDADNLKRSLGESETRLSAFSSKMEAIGSKMTSVGKNLTMGLTLPLVAGAGVAVKWAGELEDAQAMNQQVFGSMSKSMDAWAANSAKNFGLAKGEAVEWSNQFGIRLRQIGGQTEQQAAATSQSLTGLAGDFASAFGGTVPEAAQALGSALTGEFEPLKRYGVVINDLALKNKLFEMTGKKVTGTLTAQEKQQATLALIMEQSSLVSGDYARNADGATNSQRSMTATLKDAGTTLGTVLLPFVTKAAQFISDLATKFSNLSPTMQKIIVIVGVVAAALGPIIAIAGAVATAIGFIASPVGLVVAAIAALAAAIIYFYKNNESFREWVQQVAAAVKEKLAQAFQFIKDKVLPALQNAFAYFTTTVLPALVTAFMWVKERAVPIFEAIGQLISAQINVVINVVKTLMPVWSAVFNAIKAVVTAVWPAISGIISGAMSIIKGIIQTVTGIISGDWSRVWTGIKSVLSGIWSGIVGVVQGGINLVGAIVGTIGSKVGSAVSGVADTIKAPFSAAFNGIKSLWNSTVGGKGFTVPDWIPGLGGKSFSIPRFHSGGIVPGPIGKDVLANLQAGEMVLSIAQVKALRSQQSAATTTAGGTTVINVTINAGVGDPAEIGRRVVDSIRSYEKVSGSGWRAA